MSKKARLSVSIDGDVMTLDTPLNFSVRPKSLTVLAPAAPAAAPTPVPVPSETV
jgi:diacylglycerol kinase family enzyme